jgi:hypothetical protein
VNEVKYLSVIFDKTIIWRFHIDVIQAFITFDTVHFLFRNERLSVYIEKAVHKPLIKSVMTNTCPAWEHIIVCTLRNQLLQNKVLCTIGVFSRHIPVYKIRIAFKVLRYVYDCEMKLCRKQTEAEQNHENANVRNVRKSEARHRIC